MSEWRDLVVADSINAAAENGTRPGWKSKLIHVSGFLDYLNPAVQDLLGPSDIITIQRNLVTEEVFDAIRYWQGLGKTFVADLDDAYPILPWSNPAHRFWIEDPNHLNPVKALEDGLALCGYLTSPNRLILKDWEHITKGYHLPNFARDAWWLNLNSRTEAKAQRNLTDRIVIGWGGSVSHYDSWWGSGLREAATQICRRFPETVFMVCGNDPRIHAQLPVPADNKFMQPGVDGSLWPQVVKTFDIGVAPLFGPYDQRRSWIKALEYGLAGVPWLATAGEPYRDFSAFGTLVRNSVDTWVEALTHTITNLSKQQTLAAERVSFYQQFLMSKQIGTYERIFTDILQQQRLQVGRLANLTLVNWGPSK